MTRTVADLDAACDETLARANEATAGRATLALNAGEASPLTQMVLALRAGRELAEHENPGRATLQVLRGRVMLRTAAEQWELGAGQHIVIPPERHSLLAHEDAVVILTMVRS